MAMRDEGTIGKNIPDAVKSGRGARALWGAWGDEPFFNIGLHGAKNRFITLNRHEHRLEKPLGGVKRKGDALWRYQQMFGAAARLGLQREVEDQFLGGAGHAAKIYVHDLRIGQIVGRTNVGGQMGGLKRRFRGRGTHEKASVQSA